MIADNAEATLVVGSVGAGSLLAGGGAGSVAFSLAFDASGGLVGCDGVGRALLLRMTGRAAAGAGSVMVGEGGVGSGAGVDENFGNGVAAGGGVATTLGLGVGLSTASARCRLRRAISPFCASCSASNVFVCRL